MICSTGMSTDREIRESVDVLNRAGAQFSLLHCNSTYPSPFKDVNLKYMGKLREIGNCPIGYSSHDRGIHVAISAVALGANIIEKHFTMDRSMEGNDHRVSLLPGEFAEMVAGIRQTEEAVGADRDTRRLSQGELMNREVLGKSLFVNAAVNAGEIITEGMLVVRSPGRGLSPNRKAEILGRPAKRNLAPFDMLFPSDLDIISTTARNYTFPRPFGIPVRYHDLSSFLDRSNFDLFEIHLSYKDMEEDFRRYVAKTLDLDVPLSLQQRVDEVIE
jgi:N-acetylneuraminate synthase